MCVCLCVCVGGGGGGGARSLKIVSMDKILHFTNTFIIIIIKSSALEQSTAIVYYSLNDLKNVKHIIHQKLLPFYLLPRPRFGTLLGKMDFDCLEFQRRRKKKQKQKHTNKQTKNRFEPRYLLTQKNVSAQK